MGCSSGNGFLYLVVFGSKYVVLTTDVVVTHRCCSGYDEDINVTVLLPQLRSRCHVQKQSISYSTDVNNYSLL